MAATQTRGAVHTWDLNQTTLIINNVPISGFADGDTIAVARNNDDYGMSVGSGGEATFFAMNDRSGTITITLGFGSKANKVFSDLVKADRLNNGGLTEIYWREKRGGSSVSSAKSRVQRIPDGTFGREAGTLEWAFICADIEADYQGLPED